MIEKGKNMARMTKEERAKQYVNLLKKNPSRQQAQAIAKSLEGLVNADTRQPLSISSKMAILEEMEKQVSSSIILEHADNQCVLDLISTVKSIVNDNNKKG